ncbi:hypothetical protein Patl1_18407 [Pistacia atlantica]|uniref:Uncharacterized protein n=1 Tax=Pistacia atlantica TaxID=434234 RepID=A0ACC1C177_9ROSI|nr:hypothetical protein Patl1_18407 [Pistacia atlantica]
MMDMLGMLTIVVQTLVQCLDATVNFPEGEREHNQCGAPQRRGLGVNYCGPLTRHPQCLGTFRVWSLKIISNPCVTASYVQSQSPIVFSHPGDRFHLATDGHEERVPIHNLRLPMNNSLVMTPNKRLFRVIINHI